MNPMDLKRGAQMAVDEVVRVLDSISRPITTKEEVTFLIFLAVFIFLSNNNMFSLFTNFLLFLMVFTI